MRRLVDAIVLCTISFIANANGNPNHDIINMISFGSGANNIVNIDQSTNKDKSLDTGEIQIPAAPASKDTSTQKEPEGTTTDLKPVCNPACSNGQCTSPNTSSCNDGWEGPQCQTPVCNPACDNGQCTSPNICSCNDGWEGPQCQTPVCNPACDNGQCTSPNTCSCNDGWEGTQCQTPVCSPACDNGQCTSPNTCSCNDGWEGTQCQTYIQEVIFEDIDTRAKATSSISSNWLPSQAFKRGTSTGWHSGHGHALPQSIWFEFPNPVVVNIFSFRGRQEYGGSPWYISHGPSEYIFWGSNAANCEDSSKWVTLFEDYSGTSFSSIQGIKEEKIDNDSGYKCYGFKVIKTQNGQYVAISNVRFYTSKVALN